MTLPIIHQPNPRLDLIFERIADVPRGLIWTAWTTPEHLKKWFTPAPWTTVDCEIDLRPGGIFRTMMRSPAGQEFPNVGCYLEVVKNEKLVWTNTLAPGYRPATPSAAMPCDTFSFTALISLEAHGSGTKYSALVLHGDEEARKKHEELGFHDGWGKAFDQLVTVVREM
jgi:uncharacterized protein YndB with AHSA1/START domain